jgi:hypothetical protein
MIGALKLHDPKYKNTDWGNNRGNILVRVIYIDGEYIVPGANPYITLQRVARILLGDHMGLKVFENTIPKEHWNALIDSAMMQGI